MRKLILVLLCFAQTIFAQHSPAGHKLKTGDMVKEVIVYKDALNTDNYSEIPAKNHTLFYCFKDSAGTQDVADSVIALEKILSRLEPELKKLPEFKYFHVECHSHITDATEILRLQKTIDSVRTKAYETQKSSHGWAFLFLDQKKLKPNSVLKAGKLVLVGPRGKILATGYIAGFDKSVQRMLSAKLLKGKLLTEANGKTSTLENAQVSLIKAGHDKVAETFTDKYGDFELELPDTDISYTLTAKPSSPEVNNVILATQQGVQINRFRKTKDGFHFPLLKADITKLSETPEPDISMTFTKFKGSRNPVLKVTENVMYASGQFQIDVRSYAALDKVAGLLKENPAVKLEITSHTDAIGDDAGNLKLSEKRAQAVLEYLAAKGIDKTRLKATGKGESAIRNRCRNGVECSDKEHEFNRRTEFNFVK